MDDWDAWMDEYVAKHSGDRKQAEKVAKRIGASVAKRNTGTPVHYSDEYDYSIKIDGYSDKVLQKFSEYARDVAKKGSEDGCEHMYLVNTVNGEKEYYEKGLVRKDDVDDAIAEYELFSYDKTITYLDGLSLYYDILIYSL